MKTVITIIAGIFLQACMADASAADASASSAADQIFAAYCQRLTTCFPDAGQSDLQCIQYTEGMAAIPTGTCPESAVQQCLGDIADIQCDVILNAQAAIPASCNVECP